MRSALSVTQHDSRPLLWWFEQFLAEKIDMSPSYQRRSDVWSKWKRAHLIDSILNGYDVPKFYVADFARGRSQINEAKRPYAIIDGKQRFNTIFEFFQNELQLNSTAILESDERVKISDLTYLELKKRHPSLTALIENFKPVVMSVFTDDDDKIRQLFVRLNSGEAVNRAERRNAMSGLVPGMIADLTVHPFFQTRIRFRTTRMQDFNLAAKLLLIEFSGGFVDTKARDLDKFAELGIDPDRDTQRKLTEAEEGVLATLERMTAVFSKSDPLLASQGNIPVYYWIVRKRPSSTKILREFIQSFSDELKENISISREDPEEADPELSSYYASQRTTNDQGSLKTRFDILIKRIKDYQPFTL